MFTRFGILALLLLMVSPAWAGSPENLDGSWHLFQMRRHDYGIEAQWEMKLHLNIDGSAQAQVNTVSFVRVITTEGCTELPNRGEVQKLEGSYKVQGDQIVFLWNEPEKAPAALFGTEPWSFKLDNALRVTLAERWLLMVRPEQMPLEG